MHEHEGKNKSLKRWIKKLTPNMHRQTCLRRFIVSVNKKEINSVFKKPYKKKPKFNELYEKHLKKMKIYEEIKGTDDEMDRNNNN